MSTVEAVPSSPPRRFPRFRRSVVRGVALVLPPILTIVILVWIARTIEMYLLNPVEDATREVLVSVMADVRRDPPDGAHQSMIIDGRQFVMIDGRLYAPLTSGEYIPEEVHTWLRTNLPYEPMPARADVAYRRYVSARFMPRELVVPLFLCVFVLGLYLLGKLLSYGFGEVVDRGVKRLPLVRSVYSSVKRVTDFVLVENKVHYKRVVAVEYPRKGIWSVGFVSGDSVQDISLAAREPCVTVVLPGSPTPITGYTVMVPLRETHDLHMTIDQALQFYISCGVVLPKSQQAGDRRPGISAGPQPAAMVAEPQRLEG